MKKFYITTPIYYVNANPHIGHAYTQIAVDVVSRYRKMLGEDVFFLTGTDEHGEKIEEAALAAGFKQGDEKSFVDSIVVNFKKAWDAVDIAARAQQEKKAFENLAATYEASAESIIAELKRVSGKTIDTMSLIRQAGTAMMMPVP